MNCCPCAQCFGKHPHACVNVTAIWQWQGKLKTLHPTCRLEKLREEQTCWKPPPLAPLKCSSSAATPVAMDPWRGPLQDAIDSRKQTFYTFMRGRNLLPKRLKQGKCSVEKEEMSGLQYLCISAGRQSCIGTHQVELQQRSSAKNSSEEGNLPYVSRYPLGQKEILWLSGTRSCLPSLMNLSSTWRSDYFQIWEAQVWIPTQFWKHASVWKWAVPPIAASPSPGGYYDEDKMEEGRMICNSLGSYSEENQSINKIFFISFQQSSHITSDHFQAIITSVISQIRTPMVHMLLYAAAFYGFSLCGNCLLPN